MKVAKNESFEKVLMIWTCMNRGNYPFEYQREESLRGLTQPGSSNRKSEKAKKQRPVSVVVQ